MTPLPPWGAPGRTFQDLNSAIRGLRRESADALDLRARRWSSPGKRRD